MSQWPLAVIFDFDGVIVNSEPLHFLAFQTVFGTERIELGEQEYYRELLGFDDRDCFRHLYALRKIPLDSKTLLRLMASKSQTMTELIQGGKYQALPGVEELVRGLWRHYPLAICSGALRDEIEVMLQGVNLRDCFQVIVAAEDVTVGKPDPQGYLLAMKLISERIKKTLKPADCLIVEDAPAVIQSVKAAGFSTLGVASSHPIEMLAAADWAVPSLESHYVGKKIPQLKTGV